MKILLLDNFDSFTYNLKHYLEQCGATVTVVRNHIKPTAISGNYQGLVISPGPGHPKQAGYINNYIRKYAGQVPILGICLGHQALALYFESELVTAIKPVHGKVTKVKLTTEACQKDPLWVGVPAYFNAVRYHSLIINKLGPSLLATAYSDAAELMAFRHKHLPICGVQFHPEALLTEAGLQIVKNWLSIC